MRKAVLSSAVVIAIPAFSAPAQAQMICGLRDEMGRMLDQRFAEQPKAAGLAGDNVVELLVSASGSWTILITGKDGRSCVVTGGEEWTEKPIQPTGAKKDDAT
ncbi:MAG TPA: hypothetical protein VKZ87_16530 [Ferrovibrio sp.]|jgi:hypothetical protein|uniref:hypothetical protein n=1 Tax=Ferrovibrio sp. TaxID=1917215 RepID=UPI002B4B3290|nr:hypothetical protein [Ferrovibrio sp.]HLT78992.1 hypothetical protein [Ferrovibrio sp.]